MSRPLPGLDVPVVDAKTGLMTQAWYEYFQGFRIGGWSTWSPVFSMSIVGGTPITAALSGDGARFKYFEPWKTVFFTIDVTVSNVGVGNSGYFLFTLPVTGLNNHVDAVGSGREVVTTGKGLVVGESDATHGSLYYVDNTTPISGGNGTRLVFGGMYETA